MVGRKLSYVTLCLTHRLKTPQRHACPNLHLMDVISLVSHCPSCKPVVQTYIQCWRPPFTMIVSPWWSATMHVREGLNFVRGLFPLSLHAQLTTPPSGRSKQANCHNLKVAMTDRTALLLGALY